MLAVKGAGQNALNQGLGCHGLENSTYDEF